MSKLELNTFLDVKSYNVLNTDSIIGGETIRKGKKGRPVKQRGKTQQKEKENM
jgi:hypothetical protein